MTSWGQLVRADGSIVCNSAECAIAKSSGAEEVSAKPGTRLPVENTVDSRKDISERLAGATRR